ncbi:MAG: amidohydrolase [Deltaproteobacteria bacterium]|nr:amidohydrolase [Deltaproteobacteria bacterium]
MKIDIHTHILPPEIPKFKNKFGYGGFVELAKGSSCTAKMMWDDGRFFRDIESNCWDPQKRIEEADQNRVDVQVLSTVPVMFNYGIKGKDNYEVSRFLNDHIAEVVSKNPKRFVGLGTLPMQDPSLAIKELHRCIKDLKMAGVQIGSHINRWNLESQELFPVFEAAEKLGAAIFIHPWEMMGAEGMPKYWLPWLVGMPAEMALAICSLIFGGVFQRLPSLRVAFAHGGGAFPVTVGRIEQGFLVRPDLCAIDNNINPRDYLGRFWVDSLVHDPLALKFCLQVFGEDKIAMGSDYPFPLGESKPGSLIESISELSPSIKQKLLANNALNWLGLTKERF